MRNRLRYSLLLVSAASALGIFGAFVVLERPGLGLGHFFYIPIILAAFAGGPWIGAAGAVAATGLFAAGIVINPHLASSDVLSTNTGIRFVTYMTVGVVTGYFANANRTLLEELQLLAERDALTGLPNTRAFERAITERLAREQPFALLVGAVDSPGLWPSPRALLEDDEALRGIAGRLQHALPPGDEIARIGDSEFAVLTYAASAREAGTIAARLQRLIADEGSRITFGWAACPQDGTNALSLYRAADERLYARRVIQRDTSLVQFPQAGPAG